MINLAIVGSRNFTDKQLFDKYLKEFTARYGKIDKIISGGATGADSLAEKYAREHSIPITVYKPDWDKHGRAAGPIRNTLIINAANHVLAFPSRTGRGTQDSIKKATVALETGKIKVVEVHYID